MSHSASSGGQPKQYVAWRARSAVKQSSPRPSILTNAPDSNVHSPPISKKPTMTEKPVLETIADVAPKVSPRSPDEADTSPGHPRDALASWKFPAIIFMNVVGSFIAGLLLWRSLLSPLSVCDLRLTSMATLIRIRC